MMRRRGKKNKTTDAISLNTRCLPRSQFSKHNLHHDCRLIENLRHNKYILKYLVLYKYMFTINRKGDGGRGVQLQVNKI
jgi:hypothetical protein